MVTISRLPNTVCIYSYALLIFAVNASASSQSQILALKSYVPLISKQPEFVEFKLMVTACEA